MTIPRRAVLQGSLHASLAVACGTAAQSNRAAARPDETVVERFAGLPHGARSDFAQINGIRMHYVTMGSGPLVVLLHGWPETWFSWREQMRRLGSDFTVVAPDLRGCGLTELTEQGYDKRTIAADVRGLIDHLGSGPAHVVGHDMGGKAAFVMAHLYPGSVDKLVLADCLIPGTENADALNGGAWHYGFHMAEGIPEMLTKGRERDYIAAQIALWTRGDGAISEEAITEYAAHYSKPGRMTAGFDYYRALSEDAALVASFGDRRLTMPVMAITGRHGVGDTLARSLEGRADDVTSVVLKNCGHFVAEEKAEAFAQAVSRFLMS
ncbi:Soluble epoxide hydrolase [Methyloligella halotolerans]|uniref:Soluble epoxide hydrolase n=1 Tax=Methyloligella halotolerans TaxID=1177755 RepID=A0A1E2S268_9HYPH|nr:alpha/beta hydrolase [Methyloligella halotolerans]ODA68534.1 Soluble epoxide hydrolase [Methyloligella halotolerans]